MRVKVPSAFSISSSTHVLVGGTIATDLAGSNLPLITGVGSVKVADAGVLRYCSKAPGHHANKRQPVTQLHPSKN